MSAAESASEGFESGVGDEVGFPDSGGAIIVSAPEIRHRGIGHVNVLGCSYCRIRCSLETVCNAVGHRLVDYCSLNMAVGSWSLAVAHIRSIVACDWV
ncbi:hypothetical protein HYQ46_007859 [Verticillium longisporum]|nr:hypothetical protein HYQ46_007859 [Verticillium longisporum]